MPRTNAERRADYRHRHLKDTEGSLEHLNTLVSLQAKRQLERLATRYGVTQRSMSSASWLRQAADHVRPLSNWATARRRTRGSRWAVVKI
jgi:hypothetical protein